MFMNAEIEQNNYQAYVLPEEAIVNYEKQNYVFVKKTNNNFEMIPIETGAMQNGKVEIKPGTNNDLVKNTFVTEGAYTLLMKMKNTEEE